LEMAGLLVCFLALNFTIFNICALHNGRTIARYSLRKAPRRQIPDLPQNRWPHVAASDASPCAWPISASRRQTRFLPCSRNIRNPKPGFVNRFKGFVIHAIHKPFTVIHKTRAFSLATWPKSIDF
jgi:hypothetical protein